MKLFALLLAVLVLPFIPSAPPEIVKETIRSNGKQRTYYLFVPGKVSSAAPAPLLVLLHGSGRNGLSLVEKWQELAKQEGIIIVGPDSLNARGWNTPEEGPDFIHELVEFLAAKYTVNPRRIYLFGHSAGAVQALHLALLESQYFAATAIHAGALRANDKSYLGRAPRKMPIAIFVGKNDQLFPLPLVRATRDALNAHGFNSELTEIAGHTHWYYDLAPEINRSAWGFLKSHELVDEPKFEHHRFNR